MRFRGQAHQLTTPAPRGLDADALSASFSDVYEQAYGVRRSAPTELVTFRVRVVADVERWSPAALVPTGVEPVACGERLVRWPEGSASTPVFDWADLATGATIRGPALVDGPDTTVVVPGAVTATLDAHRTLVLRLA
jgi:N-methylhydantoinase A